MTNPACRIISLGIKTIDKLLLNKYSAEGCKRVAYLPSNPPPTQGLRLELLLKEVDNVPELTLCLILIVLEPISCVVILVNIQVKAIVARPNPRSAEKEKLLSSLVDKLFTSAIAGMRVSRCRDPLTFGTTSVVVGDICKLASKTAHFSLCSAFVDLVLPGNLQKTRLSNGHIICRQRLRGLLKYYQRAA